MPNRQTITKGAPGWINLSWDDGLGPPYQVWKTDALGEAWYKVGPATMRHSRAMETTGQQGYFRVQELVPLFDADVTDDNTHLFWEAPELEETLEPSEMPMIPI